MIYKRRGLSRSALAVARGGAAAQAAKNHADGEEERGDGSVGQTAAEGAVAHAEGGVDKPDGRAEKPDPVEVAAHYSLGCDAPLLRTMVSRNAGVETECAGFRSNDAPVRAGKAMLYRV